MTTKPYEIVTAGPWADRYTFSPAVRVGNFLFIAGTTAGGESGKVVAPGDIVGQTRYIYRKFEALLRAAGGSLADIVETTEYVTTTENYRKTAEVRREVFGGPPYPAATGVIVAGLLREGALIEIKAVAVLPDRGMASTPGPGLESRAVDVRAAAGPAEPEARRLRGERDTVEAP